MRRLAIAMVLLLAAGLAPKAGAAKTAALVLRGAIIQGGLIIGHAPAGAKIRLDGAPLRISPNGLFVFGFGRDAPARAVLEAVLPDGHILRRPLAVARRHYKIQHIDGLPDKMVTPPASVLARIKRENAKIAKARARDSAQTGWASGFQWPAIGPISGVYGSQRILNGQPRRPHFGVDIAMPVGTPVVAPAPGVVTLAEPDLYYTGGTLIIDHGYGVSSAFLHLSALDVTLGERVRRGQRIGAIGKTGRATGAHLDWRVNWFSTRLDPQKLVGPMPAR